MLLDGVETFGQIEAIMQEMMRGLQERHAASHTQFEITDNKLTRSLRAHNRVRMTLMACIVIFQCFLKDCMSRQKKNLK